jgi:hypothetical protein
VEEDQVEKVEEPSFDKEGAQRELKESYRRCLRLREGFYQLTSLRNCLFENYF